MKKASLPISNNFCPQTLFVYGTYRDDGTPNFGLFCWFSYCWDNSLAVMACIGGDKLTKDRLHATGIFSAGLADYFGNNAGYSMNKMRDDIMVEKGTVLDVPVLAQCPLTFELQVSQTISLNGIEIYVCKICNVLGDELLASEINPDEALQRISPIRTT